jgi:hypothetical protein
MCELCETGNPSCNQVGAWQRYWIVKGSDSRCLVCATCTLHTWSSPRVPFDRGLWTSVRTCNAAMTRPTVAATDERFMGSDAKNRSMRAEANVHSCLACSSGPSELSLIMWANGRKRACEFVRER